MRLTVVEIYCERIRDLLDPSLEALQVKQDASGSIFVDGEPRHGITSPVFAAFGVDYVNIWHMSRLKQAWVQGA